VENKVYVALDFEGSKILYKFSGFNLITKKYLYSLFASRAQFCRKICSRRSPFNSLKREVGFKLETFSNGCFS